MAYTRVTRTANGHGALMYAYGKGKGHNGSDFRNDLIANVNILPGVPAEIQMQKYWNRARANHKTQVIRVVQSFSVRELNPDEPADILTANIIGQEFVQKYYPDRQAVVFTQTDGKSGLIHNHVIISDTDMTSSRGCDKQQYYQPTLAKWTDEIAGQYFELDFGDTTVPDKTTQTERAKRALGEYVWKDDLKSRITEALNESESEEDWIKNLPAHGVNIEVHDSKKRGKYYTYELMDTDGFGDKKIPQNLKSRSYKLGTLYDAEHVQEYFSEKELEHKHHGNRNEDNEHVTVQEDETNVTLPAQEDVTPVQRAAMLPDADDWDEDEHESKSDVKRPVTGRVEIVVPDDVTSVPHYRPSKNVKVRESYLNVDEQDDIDDLVLDKSEDKRSDILAMRLQQKAERDRKRKKANSGVVEIRKDMKSVRGLSTESVMERIRGVQDEKDDRSL
ncbi:relaxase/mobilization nuclease domain-containing protein [Sporofaciens sp. SGI.106]|uniref:relaxase/mobilization nuclease domain-containing protein n=1 Tax=Sporofaciens sp. SGI.106 TaxID=3420568 RepID=UPI003D08C7B5